MVPVVGAESVAYTKADIGTLCAGPARYVPIDVFLAVDDTVRARCPFGSRVEGTPMYPALVDE